MPKNLRLYPTVFVPCPDCLQPVEWEYDPGYPDTRDEPGMPDDFYISENDTQHVTSERYQFDDTLYNFVKTGAYESEEFAAYMSKYYDYSGYSLEELPV